MKRTLLILLSLVVFVLFSTQAFAKTAAYPLENFFKGRVLVIDMAGGDEVNKDSFLNGRDLILVKLVPIENKKKEEPFQFHIIAISSLKELANLDINHNGLIEKIEMEKANIALLRYDRTGNISIDGLAHTLIKKINYKANKEGKNAVIVETKEGKSLSAYFVDM